MKNLENYITVVIKTFNRKRSLIKLLHSLEKLSCKLDILIADDSQYPYKRDILHKFNTLSLRYFTLPYDAGLAAGRNALLQHVNTPYFLLCDDDFYLDRTIDFEEVLNAMKEHNLDIAGGAFRNYIMVNSFRNLCRILLTPRLAWRMVTATPLMSRYTGNFIVENDSCTLLISNRRPGEKIFTCDLVNNFFIAKTQSVKDMGAWDNSFKLGEHEDFFFRAKQKGLKIAFVEGFTTRHYPQLHSSYRVFRERATLLKHAFVKKSGFSNYREIDIDSGKILFSYKHGQ